MSLEIIKKLREQTGAGIADVKKALDQAGGDEQKVVEFLRKAGQKMAAKKSTRDVKEGIIAIARQGNQAAVVGLNCETDFVARNQDFIEAVDQYAKELLAVGEEKFKAWVEDQIKNQLIVKIGENIQLAFGKVVTGEILGSYLHANKKVAAVVVLDSGDEALAKEVAMQVTAMNPEYNAPENVPAEVIEKEKEIYWEQLKKENKPAEMIEKILDGKINKFYTEVCLVKQPYIKDDKISIEKLLNGVKVKYFFRFSL